MISSPPQIICTYKIADAPHFSPIIQLRNIQQINNQSLDGQNAHALHINIDLKIYPAIMGTFTVCHTFSWVVLVIGLERERMREQANETHERMGDIMESSLPLWNVCC